MTLHDVGRSVGRGARPTLRKLSFFVFNPDRTLPAPRWTGPKSARFFRRSWLLRNGPRERQRPRGVKLLACRQARRDQRRRQRIWKHRPVRSEHGDRPQINNPYPKKSSLAAAPAFSQAAFAKSRTHGSSVGL